MVKSKNASVFEEMKYQIKSILRAQRKISPKEKDNFSFNQLDAIQNSINDIFVNIKVFGFIIGFFSLLVGSFGIANIMFVSVRERTRQIGIKKALGALSKVILIEFLIESIILCIIGGLFGIILVIFLGKLLSGPIGFPITLSSFNFMLGIIVSILVGMFAGFVPARRASRLKPVVAIQS
jgi:putative ABC transport system permease protein